MCSLTLIVQPRFAPTYSIVLLQMLKMTKVYSDNQRVDGVFGNVIEVPLRGITVAVAV